MNKKAADPEVDSQKPTPDEINLLDSDVQQCPYAAYKVLRDEAPFWFDERAQAWVVTRYDDLRRIALDTAHFDNTDATETRRPMDMTSEQRAR